MDFSYEYDRAALKDKDYALAVVTDSVQAFTQALLDDLQPVVESLVDQAEEQKAES